MKWYQDNDCVNLVTLQQAAVTSKDEKECRYFTHLIKFKPNRGADQALLHGRTRRFIQGRLWNSLFLENISQT